MNLVSGMFTAGVALIGGGLYFGARVFYFALPIILIGILLLLASLIVGFLIAVGGPLFARRNTEQVRVDARFILGSAGMQDFEADVPLDSPGKRFLRLEMADKTYLEVQCDPLTYDLCDEGCHGWADYRGNRLYSFKKL